MPCTFSPKLLCAESSRSPPLVVLPPQAYIRVLDMNEHRPVFQKDLYEVRVPEDTAPWKEILQVSAEDADINSRLVYSIHSSVHPDSGRHFQLDPRSGVLVMTEQLDFETLPLHILVIMVNIISFSVV